MADKKNPEDILKAIFMAVLEGVLQDLQNPERRTATLINAARGMLSDNNINLDGLKALGDTLRGEGNAAGDKIHGILESMPTFDDEDNPVAKH